MACGFVVARLGSFLFGTDTIELASKRGSAEHEGFVDVIVVFKMAVALV